MDLASARRLFARKEKQLLESITINASYLILKIAAKELLEASIILGIEEAKAGAPWVKEYRIRRHGGPDWEKIVAELPAWPPEVTA